MTTVVIERQINGDRVTLENVKDIEVNTITVGEYNSTKEIDLVHVNQFGQDGPSVWNNSKVVSIKVLK